MERTMMDAMLTGRIVTRSCLPCLRSYLLGPGSPANTKMAFSSPQTIVLNSYKYILSNIINIVHQVKEAKGYRNESCIIQYNITGYGTIMTIKRTKPLITNKGCEIGTRFMYHPRYHRTSSRER